MTNEAIEKLMMLAVLLVVYLIIVPVAWAKWFVTGEFMDRYHDQ